MIFRETRLKGAWVIEPEPVRDERGFFARTYCEEEFASRGLETRYVQSNISYNRRRGTLRGLHYQVPPHEEAKVVRCTRGSMWDVIVDLRGSSSTFGKWIAHELSDDNRLALYVPKGFAHGFQALSDDVEVLYHMSTVYHPGSAAGIRFDDPAISIQWPLPAEFVSERDRLLPLLAAAASHFGR
jgi:dTDP-4-dehydrorhamnose 3,5-epimerase